MARSSSDIKEQINILYSSHVDLPGALGADGGRVNLRGGEVVGGGGKSASEMLIGPQ